MWYETDLMRSILKSDYAQKAVDQVSSIYGNAYYVLWLFQVIGIEFDYIESFVQDLQDNQLSPETATWALKYYEKNCGIEVNEDLSYEERRARIMLKNSIVPINPARMEFVVKTLTGRDVHIIERIAPNTFEIDIENGASEADIDRIYEIMNQIKQAHMIFKIVFNSDVSVAIRASPKNAKLYYNMTSTTTKTGTRPNINIAGRKAENELIVENSTKSESFPYPLSGTVPDVSNVAAFERMGVVAESNEQGTAFEYNTASERTRSGTYPDIKNVGNTDSVSIDVENKTDSAEIDYPITGTIPGQNTIGNKKDGTLEANSEGKAFSVSFKICGKNKL